MSHKGLIEYSVVYTDHALNHMSDQFNGVMNELSQILKDVYKADHVAIIPGSGTFAMESVARQFITNEKCFIVRNGFFSYRWSQIIEAGSITSQEVVFKAKTVTNSVDAPFEPYPIESLVKTIQQEKPSVICAAHVETSSGMMLTDDYIKQMADAVHSVGGILVLDCIASGCAWVDMKATGVDVLISAPQKGWSGYACCGYILLNEKAYNLSRTKKGTSFSCDLNRWLDVMKAYEKGAHAYHTTMPTDAIQHNLEMMKQAGQMGFEKLKSAQAELGKKVRDELKSRGTKSVATDEFAAPGVIVCYTPDAGMSSGAKFKEQGLQIASGVALMCDEPEGFRTFRLGLFGLDKLNNIDKTVSTFTNALDNVLA